MYDTKFTTAYVKAPNRTIAHSTTAFSRQVQRVILD